MFNYVGGILLKKDNHLDIFYSNNKPKRIIKAFNIRINSFKFNVSFSRKLSRILIVMIISLMLMSSISYASDDSFSSKKFTFMGDDETSTSNNDNQQDNYSKLDDNQKETISLETNITAQVTNNTVNHVMIEVNVTDINNNSVNNGTITVKNQDNTIVNNVSIDNGSVSIGLPLNNPGNYELLIIYNSTDEYKDSQVILFIDVKNEDVKSTFIQQENINNSNQKSSSNSIVSGDTGSTSYYIGNANSGKFHSRNCREVDKMNENNKVPFNSREEAIKNGYKPCKKCKA